MKKYFIMDDTTWSNIFEGYDVPYLFYGGHPKKWRRDAACLSKDQIVHLERHGRTTHRFGINLKTVN